MPGWLASASKLNTPHSADHRRAVRTTYLARVRVPVQHLFVCSRTAVHVRTAVRIVFSLACMTHAVTHSESTRQVLLNAQRRSPSTRQTQGTLLPYIRLIVVMSSGSSN